MGNDTRSDLIEAACAVIEQEGRFLITLRLETSPMGHCWEFPGGKMELHETVEECIIRECREEIAVEVIPLRRLEDARYDYPHGKILLHFVLCRIVSGEPRPVACRKILWIRPDEFGQYEFPPADIGVIERLRKLG